ncbi:MAG: LUD domain-containing protein [Phycisphaerae bacterium]|nr:LUD domain-containing protein [Phycisphaerae bacterium]
MSDPAEFIARVRRSLGRSAALTPPPTPPAPNEPLTRLVHTDIGLPALFTATAKENKIDIESLRVEDLADQLATYLNGRSAKTIALAAVPMFQRLELVDGLRSAGLDARWWSEMTLDELYEFDCGITDVFAAVAETGSLVVRPTPSSGRGLSLVPVLHVAIVEPKNLLPDLVDLFDKLQKEGVGSGVSIITGPSKTSDIEMNLVTGVHGPHHVKVFLLE